MAWQRGGVRRSYQSGSLPCRSSRWDPVVPSLLLVSLGSGREPLVSRSLAVVVVPAAPCTFGGGMRELRPPKRSLAQTFDALLGVFPAGISYPIPLPSLWAWLQRPISPVSWFKARRPCFVKTLEASGGVCPISRRRLLLIVGLQALQSIFDVITFVIQSDAFWQQDSGGADILPAVFL